MTKAQEQRLLNITRPVLIEVRRRYGNITNRIRVLYPSGYCEWFSKNDLKYLKNTCIKYWPPFRLMRTSCYVTYGLFDVKDRYCDEEWHAQGYKKRSKRILTNTVNAMKKYDHEMGLIITTVIDT